MKAAQDSAHELREVTSEVIKNWDEGAEIFTEPRSQETLSSIKK